MGIHNYNLSDPTETPGFDTVEEDGQYHIWKWWDVTLVEELHMVERVSRSCEAKCDIGIPKDIESKLNSIAVLEGLVKHSHTEIVEMRKKLKLASFYFVGIIIGLLVVYVVK
ncbi:unnamed protein product [Cochlearia groenlandica]